MLPWLSDTFQHAFAFERAVVSPYTFATVFVPGLCTFYLMAVLVQVPSTRLYRAALLPVVFWMALRVSMSLDLSGNYPGYALLNQMLAGYVFAAAMRSTAWVLSQDPYTRLPTRRLADGAIDDHDGNAAIEHDVSIPTAMWNACDLILNFRGIGWRGPPRFRVPKPYFQVESRLTFFLLSLGRLALFLFGSDGTSAFVQFLGPDTVGTPAGGSIFDPSLPLLRRYAKSSTFSLLAYTQGYFTMSAIFQLHAALCTLLFQQHPSQWPPVFHYPWCSTTVTNFWGHRWQQVFREPFVGVGSKLLETRFGRKGRILGAFAISGVLHDVGMRGMGRGPHVLPMMTYFLLQGVVLIMEREWEQATGRPIGGIVGRLWTFFVLILSGHIIVESWAKGGVLGAELLPEAYRPTRLLLNWLSGKNGL